MKETPIPFSAPMVRAILDGQKTQTRRVVKVPAWATDIDTLADVRIAGCDGDGDWHELPCAYGQKGDRLWVRETWQAYDVHEVELGCYEAGYPLRDIPKSPPVSGFAVDYAADGDDAPGGRWRPSIHMPRWASRITLEIVSVRVERLQDISLDDAKAEGVETTDQYAALWAKINGWESWNANPWVWVIEFRCPQLEEKDDEII
ncbi:MAG: hypothetical protein FJ279_03615 [Planctomycetes bacterium]|nr:hypothetical protein [Planctomycetota bacterium]